MSLYSKEDLPLPISSSGGSESATSLNPAKPSFSYVRSSESHDASVRPENLQITPSAPSTSGAPFAAGDSTTRAAARPLGLRAAEATVRPSPIFTSGTIRARGFDLTNATFTLEIADAMAPGEDGPPTEVFLPDFHFPRDYVQVEVTSGRWSISAEEFGPSAAGPTALVQMLRWWHGAGQQQLTVRGVKRRLGVPLGTPEVEEGYLKKCSQMIAQCQLM